MPGSAQVLPKMYRTRMSTYWWLGRWPYLKFILRELSSVFVAWFVIMTLLQIDALRRGPADYMGFQDWLRSPVVIALNIIVFFFLVFQGGPGDTLPPKATAIRGGRGRVPAVLIAGPNYIAWVAI